MTVRDTQATLQNLYHVDVSTDVVNKEVQLWRYRPLEAIYPVVWLDGLVLKLLKTIRCSTKRYIWHLLSTWEIQIAAWYMDSRTWRSIILSAGSYRAEQQRCQRCVCFLRRCPYWTSQCDKGLVPQIRHPLVHSAPSSEQPEICKLDISQGISAWVEREIASNLYALGTQLGEYSANLHVSFRDKTSDIRDQRYSVA